MERWYWIELIGFDNTTDDFGVGAFLSRNVTTDGVSLLFSHADFLFSDKEELPVTAASYFGHEYNRERRRQDWTRAQLSGLVSALHERGVKVFLSSFDMTREITDEDMLCFNKDGRPERLIYAIKPGVGERVIERIAKVLDEFSFDGLQLADGLSSNRMSIENGDFSLELCRGAKFIPERLMLRGSDAYRRRRSWILRNARREWTEYISSLWGEFYVKLFERIKKPIMFNSTWTRDSFEALWRYGLDYRKCCIDRAFAVMVEENSATRGIVAPEDEGGVCYPPAHRDTFTYEYSLMQRDIRIATRGAKQISLMPISDTMEQWDALRHCPTELARATVRRYNNFVFRDGKFEVAADAPLYCLSDGVGAEDWRWLAKQEGYRIPMPDYVDGFAAVAAPEALDRELSEFSRGRGYYSSSLNLEMVMGGLSLGATVSFDDVCDFDRARGLLLTGLNAYTDEMKEKLSRVRIPMLALGEDVDLPIPKAAYYKGKYVSVALYGDVPEVDLSCLAAFDKSERAGRSTHGELWCEPLVHRRVSPKLFSKLADVINEAFGLDRSELSGVKIDSFISGDDIYVILSNDLHTYALPTVRTAGEITEAVAMMKECGYKVRIRDDKFTVRIPPRCAEIVRLKTK